MSYRPSSFPFLFISLSFSLPVASYPHDYQHTIYSPEGYWQRTIEMTTYLSMCTPADHWLFYLQPTSHGSYNSTPSVTVSLPHALSLSLTISLSLSLCLLLPIAISLSLSVHVYIYISLMPSITLSIIFSLSLPHSLFVSLPPSQLLSYQPCFAARNTLLQMQTTMYMMHNAIYNIIRIIFWHSCYVRIEMSHPTNQYQKISEEVDRSVSFHII